MATRLHGALLLDRGGARHTVPACEKLVGRSTSRSRLTVSTSSPRVVDIGFVVVLVDDRHEVLPLAARSGRSGDFFSADDGVDVQDDGLLPRCRHGRWRRVSTRKSLADEPYCEVGNEGRRDNSLERDIKSD